MGTPKGAVLLMFANATTVTFAELPEWNQVEQFPQQ